MAVRAAPEHLRATDGGPCRGVTARAVLIGAAGVAAFSLANPYLAFDLNTWSAGSGSLLGGPIQALFLLVLLNGALLRWRPRWALKTTELLVVYAMLVVSVGWLIQGGLPFWVSYTVYPFYMATPGNDWQHLIWPHIPAWLQLSRPEAVLWYWEGKPEGAGVPWHAWLRPAVAWTAFTAALMLAMFCLSALLRKDWIERQRLTFPLVDVPLSLAGGAKTPSLGTSLMRNRIFWIGFAVPAAMALIRWLHRFFPNVPALELWAMEAGRYFSGLGLPWNVLSGIRVTIDWAVIGISALLPTEISLSLWLFYVLAKVQLVGWAVCGITPGSARSFVNPETFIAFEEAGALIALAAVLLYESRHAIIGGWRGLVRRTAENEDPYEPLPGRCALLGFLAANAFMSWFGVHTGMPWWAFAVMMGIYYLVVLMATRLVAAGGVMFVHTGFYLRQLLVSILGTPALGPSSLVMSAYFVGIYADDPANLAMPQMMNTFKLGHTGRIKGQALSRAAAVAIVVVLAASLPALLAMLYHGGSSRLGWWPFYSPAVWVFGEVDTFLRGPQPADNWLRLAMGIGAAIGAGLIWLHAHVPGWPVSPIGFVIASGWGTNYVLWASAFVGWLLASVIKRWGGLRLYRVIRPAFLGLVLGDILGGGLFSVIDTALNLHKLAG